MVRVIYLAAAAALVAALPYKRINVVDHQTLAAKKGQAFKNPAPTNFDNNWMQQRTRQSFMCSGSPLHRLPNSPFSILHCPATMVRVIYLAAAAALVAALPYKRINVVDVVQELKQRNVLERADAALPVPTDNWVTQQVDNFDPSNAKTWQQRYHYNTAWWGGEGYPVFVYINGENVADPSTPIDQSFFMNELAVKHKALVVSLEHRFYGQSQPTGDLSNDSLQYLTMENALADLANFQDVFQAKLNLTDSNKWITFGGSYPGMLSGFAKGQYPDRFAGSIASSAPVDTKVDMNGYADTVAFALQYYGGDACTNTVSAGVKAVHDLLASPKPEDATKLNKLFNFCSPIKNDWDRGTVEGIVFGNFQGIVQYNNLMGPDTLTVPHVCKYFANSTHGATPLEKLASFTRKYWDSRNCTGSDYDTENIVGLSNATMGAGDGIMRQWVFQTCNQFGFAQTTASATSFWNQFSYWSVDVGYTEMCKRVYGITDTEDRTQASRDTFGGLDIDSENTVWPNGNIDPWHTLSFTNDTLPVNDWSQSLFIDGTAHCADMYNSKYNLVPQYVHDNIEAQIVKFLANHDDI
ncbi:Aste57867_5108 [Aphanomyces stellatus]|uniref:Aste57867_5108 protein n=2 Tax=Aphanomyces stellatus TaxID=120398 RepID=A0A485KGE9_9STRA|nr:hypothetical protein As57867_005095 [Aphanomyces stellatus]VFT82188.1 Aste57867_5108 [Aphanomyces stellatus]